MKYHTSVAVVGTMASTIAAAQPVPFTTVVNFDSSVSTLGGLAVGAAATPTLSADGSVAFIAELFEPVTFDNSSFGNLLLREAGGTLSRRYDPAGGPAAFDIRRFDSSGRVHFLVSGSLDGEFVNRLGAVGGPLGVVDFYLDDRFPPITGAEYLDGSFRGVTESTGASIFIATVLAPGQFGPEVFDFIGEAGPGVAPSDAEILLETMEDVTGPTGEIVFRSFEDLDTADSGNAIISGLIEVGFSSLGAVVLVEPAGDGEPVFREVLRVGQTLTGLDGSPVTINRIRGNFFATTREVQIAENGTALVTLVVQAADGPADAAVLIQPGDPEPTIRVIAQNRVTLPGTTIAPDTFGVAQLSADGRRVALDALFDDVFSFTAFVADVPAPDQPISFTDIATLGPTVAAADDVSGVIAALSPDGRLHFSAVFSNFNAVTSGTAAYAEDGYGNLRQVIVFGIGNQGGVGVPDNGGDDRGRVVNAFGDFLLRVTPASGSSQLRRYTLPHPDRDRDGDLDKDDLITFLSDLDSENATADADADGELTVFDLLLQLQKIDAAN